MRHYPLKGLKKLDDYTFEITLKGEYPQFLFWLAMPFFSPIPWEADLILFSAGMADKNITLSWYPIGTGPFMLTQNNPNRRMVLEKNPNFREDYYPSVGSEEDKKLGYLDNAGKRLPLIDKAILLWKKNLFLVGINFCKAIMIFQRLVQTVLIRQSILISMVMPV